ncbi:MAG: menaquinone biosynthesis decarboxylase, partial [Candidatus Poribacteria bacterium]|nr:menaquinone biosynthesis decarboxylase [Candidatus Poribacteria bacterium]
MAYSGLADFVDTLDQAGELLRIKLEVSPELEVAEITDRVSKSKGGGSALLFENVAG